MLAIAIAALVDARSGYIFDPIIVVGLLSTFAAAILQQRTLSTVVGAWIAGAIMLAIRLASRNRGMGLGDVKLGALLGAGLGPLDAAVGIGAAFVLGAGVASGLLVAGRIERGTRVPFGPYLLAGSLCALAYHRLRTGVFT